MRLFLFFLVQGITLAEFVVDDDSQLKFELLLTDGWWKFVKPWGEDEFLSRGVNINQILKLIPPTETFSGMIKEHVKGARMITKALSQQNSLETFLELATQLRWDGRINHKAWLTAIIKATLLEPKLKNLKLHPSLPELMPDAMFAREDLQRAMDKDECVSTDETMGADSGEENVLWYFRQDVFANSHHYYWHVYYEFTDPIWRDRRGELFAFMHHEFLARYAAERLTHKLSKVSPLQIVSGEPMTGYNSHLTDANSKHNYTPRLPNTPLTDVHENTVEEIRKLIFLILDAIDDGYVVDSKGYHVNLRNEKGLDIIGDLVQANVNSVNQELYNDIGLHNLGHFLIANAMDPSGKLKIPPGVILYTSTSFRDPIFFEFHSTIEEIFQYHLEKLEPYGPYTSKYPLTFDDVIILNLEVKHVGEKPPINKLHTEWAYTDFNLTHGLDWSNTDKNDHFPPVKICSKHLAHKEFEYSILFKNLNVEPIETTVRIFLAPRFDINGARFSMEIQRRLFFTMDKFVATLNAGTHVLVKSSLESKLTIPSRSWLENLHSKDDYCGCGWPAHLLLPQGSKEGSTYDLFVMITNGVEDAVFEVGNKSDDTCINAPVWCGVRDAYYPDSKPMGYPFDRKPYSVGSEIVKNLEEYVYGIPNMKSIQITITGSH